MEESSQAGSNSRGSKYGFRACSSVEAPCREGERPRALKAFRRRTDHTSRDSAMNAAEQLPDSHTNESVQRGRAASY